MKLCIRLLVELSQVQLRNLGDRDDRVDLISSGNTPLTAEQDEKT